MVSRKLLVIIPLLIISEIIGYLNYKYANETVDDLNKIIYYAKASMNLTAICYSKNYLKTSIGTIGIISDVCSMCLQYNKSCEACNYVRSILQTYNGEPLDIISKKLLENEEIKKYYENTINEIHKNASEGIEKFMSIYKRIETPNMLIPLTLNIYYYSYFIFYPRIVKSSINITEVNKFSPNPIKG